MSHTLVIQLTTLIHECTFMQHHWKNYKPFHHLCWTIHYLVHRLCPRPCTKDKIIETFTCNSRNLLYVIQCTTCDKQYLGKTSTTLRNRMLHHQNKFSSHTSNGPYLYRHFDKHGWTALRVTPVKYVPPTRLLTEETRLIYKLNTTIPHSLNTKFHLYLTYKLQSTCYIHVGNSKASFVSQLAPRRNVVQRCYTQGQRAIHSPPPKCPQ